MIKYILILLLMIVLSSNTKLVTNDVEEFHIKIIGNEKVAEFKSKFPIITNNREVYIAYLQKYYKGHEDDFISLINK